MHTPLVFSAVFLLLLSSSMAARLETDTKSSSDQLAKDLSSTRRCFTLCREFSNCVRCLFEKRRPTLYDDVFEVLTTPEPAAAKKRIMKLTASTNFRQPMRFGKRKLRQPMRFGKRGLQELRQPMRFGKRELRQPMRFGKREQLELRQPMRFGKRELRQPMRFGKRDDDGKDIDPPVPFREPMRFGKRSMLESLEVAALFKPDYGLRLVRDMEDSPDGAASLEADASLVSSHH